MGTQKPLQCLQREGVALQGWPLASLHSTLQIPGLRVKSTRQRAGRASLSLSNSPIHHPSIHHSSIHYPSVCALSIYSVSHTALCTGTQQRKFCAALRAPKLGSGDEQPNEKSQYSRWGVMAMRGWAVQIITMVESRRASWRKGCFLGQT